MTRLIHSLKVSNVTALQSRGRITSPARPFPTTGYYRPQRSWGKVMFLPPANEVCEGYVFTGVHGGRAWLLRGACVVAPRGGVHGCSWGGMCVVAPRGGAWLLLGGHVWLLPAGGHAWLLWGACMGYDEIWRYNQ